MKKYLLMAMAVLAALSLMVAGCGGKEEAKKAEPAKVLRVGTEPTFAPFEFQKEGSKEYTGFDMDLIRAIGKQLGYKVFESIAFLVFYIPLRSYAGGYHASTPWRCYFISIVFIIFD